MRNDTHIADEWLTKSEVAREKGVTPVTVRNWAEAGLLPVTRTAGGVRLFRRSDVERFLADRANAKK